MKLNKISAELTDTSSKTIKKTKKSYKIPRLYNPVISDELYIQKKVMKRQKTLKKRQTAAVLIQRAYRRYRSRKIADHLKLLNSRLNSINTIFYKRLSSHLHKFASIASKNIIFDIIGNKLVRSADENIKKADTNMVSKIFAELTQEIVLMENKTSRTFNDLFSPRDPSKGSVLEESSTAYKDFDNFEDIHFSRFDFMELELPPLIDKDLKYQLFSTNQLIDRVSLLEEKINSQSTVLIKELEDREALTFQREFLNKKIKSTLASIFS